jgi:hypothetical protein
MLNVMDVVGTIVKHQSDHIDHMNSYIQDRHPYSAGRGPPIPPMDHTV